MSKAEKPVGHCWSAIPAEMRATPRGAGQGQLEGKGAGEHQQRSRRRNRTGSMRSREKGLPSGRDLCMFKAKWTYGCNLLFFWYQISWNIYYFTNILCYA